MLKIAFADRSAATADPAFVQVPVEKLLSKDYAAHRRARIDLARAQQWSADVAPGEGAHTTHLTVADAEGNVVASTQTINSLFGARYIVPGTGMIPNNYMFVFTPHAGQANSVAPGKRVTSSMSPVIVLRDGRPRYALGLPGGLRIFPSVMQALSNLIDHGMSVQEAVEAPRLWTQGFGVEVEDAVPAPVIAELRVAWPRRGCGGQCRRRHERDPVRSGWDDDRRRLLACRRHADRARRRTGAAGGAVQAGSGAKLNARSARHAYRVVTGAGRPPTTLLRLTRGSRGWPACASHDVVRAAHQSDRLMQRAWGMQHPPGPGAWRGRPWPAPPGARSLFGRLHDLAHAVRPDRFGEHFDPPADLPAIFHLQAMAMRGAQHLAGGAHDQVAADGQ